MNLIHLEGKREVIIAIQQRFKSSDSPNRYDLFIKSINEQIHALTKGLPPNELTNQWSNEYSS